jgi:glycosidase
VDYFEIDPVLGTLEDFDRLVKKAHKLKLRVILDGVFNHCSRGFFQFNSLMELGEHSPYVDWFHVKGWPLNAYTDKPNYECWWNFPALPKFNTDCPDVREYLFSVGEYWMKRGIDGWRLDVPNEIDDDSFWQEFRRRVKKVNPDAYIVGEIWDEPSRWLKGDQFDGVMNYVFRKATMQFLFDENPISIKEFGERLQNAFPEGRGDIPMNLLGSHDTTRLMSQPCASLERIKLAYTILFFLPGAPCIYYGEELSMKGGKDPDNRRSVPWSKLSEMQAKPLYEFIKQIVELRNMNAVLRDGSLEIRAADNGFAIERSLGKKTMTLVVLQDGSEYKFNII